MLVKDLDKFDMIFQAWEYEKGIRRRYNLVSIYNSTPDVEHGKQLQEFFDSTNSETFTYCTHTIISCALNRKISD